MASAKPLSIAMKKGPVSGLLQVPQGARAAFVLAHGAGAGMNMRS